MRQVTAIIAELRKLLPADRAEELVRAETPEDLLRLLQDVVQVQTYAQSSEEEQQLSQESPSPELANGEKNSVAVDDSC